MLLGTNGEARSAPPCAAAMVRRGPCSLSRSLRGTFLPDEINGSQPAREALDARQFLWGSDTECRSLWQP